MFNTNYLIIKKNENYVTSRVIASFSGCSQI